MASLYLIYDAIAADVGGAHALRKKPWVIEKELKAFTEAANSTRNIADGPRHGNKPQSSSKMTVITAYRIINRLVVFWLASKIQDNS